MAHDAGPRLQSDPELEASSVVANCAMNRERGLAGVNSYARELGFDPVEWLGERATTGPVGWLDLCCGSGRALVEASDAFGRHPPRHPVSLLGVDLVDAFEPHAGHRGPILVAAPMSSWEPPHRFDLVTCVHGLHYVGDKLGLLARAAGWLAGAGLLVADLDLANVRLAGGGDARRRVARRLRSAGFDWDARRHRVTRRGGMAVDLGYRYLGADDRAGPNYTGQSAVDSHYVEEVWSSGPGIGGGRRG